MQCTSPIVNFAPSEDKQSVKQSVSPLKSIAHFAPISFINKPLNQTITQTTTFFPLSPQLIGSPLKRSIDQSANQSPSLSAFKLDPDTAEPTLNHSDQFGDSTLKQSVEQSDKELFSEKSDQTKESTMQRVHREKSIRSPMRKRLSQSFNQPLTTSTDQTYPNPLFSPAGEPITVDSTADPSIIQSRNQSFNKEYDESINDVTFVKLDQSPETSRSQSIEPALPKVDHLLKEVDSALFGQNSLANELAQARKEDELVDQSSNPPIPGLKFNQSVDRLLEDDSLLDEINNSLHHPATSTTPPSLAQQPNVTNTEQTSGHSIQADSAESERSKDDGLSIVGKQVPVRFVVPPADAPANEMKQDNGEALSSVGKLFSPSKSPASDDKHISEESIAVADTTAPVSTDSATAPIIVERMPAGVVRTYHLTSGPLAVEDKALASSESPDQSVSQSTAQPSAVKEPSVEQSESESAKSVSNDEHRPHSASSPVTQQPKITLTPPTPVMKTVDNDLVKSDSVSGKGMSNSAVSRKKLADQPPLQASPSPPPSQSEGQSSASQSISKSPSPSFNATSQSITQSFGEFDKSSAPISKDPSQDSAEKQSIEPVSGSSKLEAADDLEFKENNRPSLSQENLKTPVQESAAAPRSIPPSMSQQELHNALLPRLSPGLELLSVDVPNEVEVVSPQALAARRLLEAELAKSPVVDVDIEPVGDSDVKVEVHPSKRNKRKKSKSKRATPSPLSLSESAVSVSEGSIAEGSSAKQQDSQSSEISVLSESNLPEPSEELHEPSPQHADEAATSASADDQSKLDNDKQSPANLPGHSTSAPGHDDGLSIDAQREHEPRLYSLPSLTPYNPESEWSPDAEREKTGEYDKYYTDKSEDTHDNALLGLDNVDDKVKEEVPKKLPSPPPQSTTQDEEAFWRLQAEEYAYEYPRTAITFVHSICAQSTLMRFLFVSCLVLNLVAPLMLFLHTNEGQVTILCQLLTFACAYWIYAKHDFVTAVFASQALLFPSILYIYESFVNETSFMEFIAVVGTYLTSPSMWWNTSLICYLWLCASLVLQVVCLTGGTTIAFRGRA